MLILSRKLDETVILNNDIKIIVVDIRGDRIRLGIEAPKDVSIHRGEIHGVLKRDSRTGGEQ